MDGLSLGTLKTKDGNELKAETLFSEKPVVVVVLRRPGCGKLTTSQDGLTNIVTQLIDLCQQYLVYKV